VTEAAQVAEARKPASAIAWRSESIQRGSNARRRASAQPMHASSSTAARTAATIATVESVSECFAACVAGRPTMTDLTVVVGIVVVAGLVVGVVALAGAIVPEAVVIGCTLADAGIGKVVFEVGVELLLPAICL
jgi:hypothetical protein